ncbi:hypothetical protein DIPPA_08657 [Diplonema papillatum]|nr:hypothetical protein DIPPA_08657 [Diplonema papillatum]
MTPSVSSFTGATFAAESAATAFPNHRAFVLRMTCWMVFASSSASSTSVARPTNRPIWLSSSSIRRNRTGGTACLLPAATSCASVQSSPNLPCA